MFYLDQVILIWEGFDGVKVFGFEEGLDLGMNPNYLCQLDG